MTVGLVQANLVWEDRTSNLLAFEDAVTNVDADLIILPEMFTTGFTMDPDSVAETMSGETVSWMRAMASDKDCAICGSVVISENGRFYNRLIFALPNGEIQTYNKRHLFSLAGENKKYNTGSDRLIVNYRGWKICPLICYDLRFPVFSRNSEDYDLLLYVANWPKPRIQAWDVLLRARAVENLAYVIGVNRVGKDDNGHEYPGHSQAIDCLGSYLIAPFQDAAVKLVKLSKSDLHETRQKLGFLNDRDEFTVT